MFDFTSVDISKLIVHWAGNRLKNEGVVQSRTNISIDDNILKNLLLKYFLAPFKSDVIYTFRHETNINLNEVYNYVRNIFNDNSSFNIESANILKHLYEVTTHPNIKSGELYVAYLSQCVIENKIVDAVGIFKSENKDTYIKVSNQDNNFGIQYHSGVNINKLDKGCLIFNIESDKGYRIALVDSASNYEAAYWREDFLNIEACNNEYVSTKEFLELCKNFTNDVYNKEKNEKVTFLNNSIEYFNKNNEFNLETFIDETLEEPVYAEKFKDFVESHEKEVGHTDFRQFDISPKAVKVIKRKIRNLIKLDTDIEIRINSSKNIEKGFDEQKGMHFYKIYFNNEE